MSNRTVTITMFLLLGALGAGCSGGSGSETDAVLGGGGGSTLLTPTFRPDEPNPGPGTVALEPLFALSDTVTVGVNITDTSNVASATLELEFDPNRVQFVDWSCGDAFPPCNGPTLAEVSAIQGRLVIGLAQTGSGAGVEVTGTATLIRLTFRAIAPGVSRLDFDRAQSALGGPDLLDIPGIQWYGGLIDAD